MDVFARVKSLGLLGIDGFLVDVEADLSQGLPGFDVVGLPGTAVRESRDRVRAAMKNGGFTYPVSRITVNLAPADIKKEGSIYDLPLFLALLRASGQLKSRRGWEESAFLGELSLTGEIRPVRGVLPMVIAARDAGLKQVFVPAANAAEGAIVEGIAVYPAADTAGLLAHLNGEAALAPARPVEAGPVEDAPLPDFADVMGQAGARRAMEIAAAGSHNLLLIGPPGSGKSMLAKRLPSILPDMSPEEALEATKIHSIAGTLPGGTGLLRARPFRAPHHNISAPGLTGGGSVPRPGEVSLAHNGVLFLDELPEFNRMAMESLRQPLEDGRVTITRVGATLSYPCSLMLVAAMNPCPCGYFGHPSRECTCSPRRGLPLPGPGIRPAARPDRSAYRGAAGAIRRAGGPQAGGKLGRHPGTGQRRPGGAATAVRRHRHRQQRPHPRREAADLLPAVGRGAGAAAGGL